MHYCFQMFLKVLDIKVLYIKVNEIDPANFLSARGLAWSACLKKAKVQLYLSTDFDMPMMV